MPTLRTFFAFLPTLAHRLCGSSQQKRNFCLPKVPFLFIQAAGLVYHHDAVVYIISPFGAVSHHAPACICLRFDDIPQQVADDIHAFGVIWRETVEMFTDLLYNEIKILASINTAKENVK